MSQPEERLRPHPAGRLSGPVVPLSLRELARGLHAEAHPAVKGHRQMGLVHRGPLRLVLFAFESGSELPRHQAPGHVMIHCIRGDLEVDAAGAQHRLPEGEALFLDPEVPHSLRALTESDVLLTVCIEPKG